MKKSVWGPLIWRFLHVLSIKIKESEFFINKEKIINLVLSVCDNLPCPSCASHARGYLKKINFINIKTKEHLIVSIWKMHNEVNKANKKPSYDYDKLINSYQDYNFEKCAINFFKAIQQMNYGDKMMIYSFQRRQFIKKYVSTIRDNLHWFD